MRAPRDIVGEAVATSLSMRFLHDADLSPDGTCAAWIESRIEGDAEVFALHLVTLLTEMSREVLIVGSVTDPAWSPDGSRIALVRHDAGVPALVLLDVESDVAEVVSLPGVPVGPVTWSPDGRYVAYVAPPPARDPSLPYRVTRTIGWFDGLGLVDDAAADLHIVEVASGDVRQLTDDHWVNMAPTWTRGSDGLYFLATCGPDDQTPSTYVRRVSFDGTHAELYGGPGVNGLALTADGIAVLGSGGFPPHQGSVVLIDEAGQVHPRTSELPIDVGGDVYTDMPVHYADTERHLFAHDDEIVVRVQVADRLEIHAVGLSGTQRHRTLVAGPTCAYPLAVRAGRLLYAEGTLTSAPRLKVLDLITGATADVAVPSTRPMAPLEVLDLSVPSAVGGQTQAWFLRRPGAEGPLPTVLLIHGGPALAFGQAFLIEAQLLCEAGFGVIIANPPGSRGYGTDFSTAIAGRWGTVDYADLMAVVDQAVTRSYADPDRLGVTGMSYGGYMSAWIIGHTRRFKAAVIENPVTNLWSLYGTGDVGRSYIAASTGGPPSEVFENYVASSPIVSAHTSRTPTLVVQSEQDHRCPPEQGIQLYATLRAAGCVAELLMLPDCSHAGSINGPVPARTAQNAGLVDWMVTYV